MDASLAGHWVVSGSTMARRAGLVGFGARREMVCTALGEGAASRAARMCEPETPVLPKTRLEAMVVCGDGAWAGK